MSSLIFTLINAAVRYLTQYLPQSALDGGNAALVAAITSSGSACGDFKEMKATPRYWSDITVSSGGQPGNEPLVGKTISEIAECAAWIQKVARWIC